LVRNFPLDRAEQSVLAALVEDDDPPRPSPVGREEDRDQEGRKKPDRCEKGRDQKAPPANALQVLAANHRAEERHDASATLATKMSSRVGSMRSNRSIRAPVASALARRSCDPAPSRSLSSIQESRRATESTLGSPRKVS